MLLCDKFQHPKRPPAPPEPSLCEGGCISAPRAACHLRHAFFEVVLCHFNVVFRQKEHILGNPEGFSVDKCHARYLKRGVPWGKRTTNTGNQNASLLPTKNTCLCPHVKSRRRHLLPSCHLAQAAFRPDFVNTYDTWHHSIQAQSYLE